MYERVQRNTLAQGLLNILNMLDSVALYDAVEGHLGTFVRGALSKPAAFLTLSPSEARDRREIRSREPNKKLNLSTPNLHRSFD